jgi:hypothetical protein
MIRKSGYRFSEEIMLKTKSMIRKSGSRFSTGQTQGVCAQIMLTTNSETMIRFNRIMI